MRLHPQPELEPTVYIVDDDSSVRSALKRIVTAFGFKTEVYDSASQFLLAAPRTSVGCVVLDVCMPEIPGPELQVCMARDGLSLAVVMLTGQGDVPTSVEAMKNGAVDFLMKPVDESILREAIDRALAQSEDMHRRSVERRAIEGRLATLSSREREVMEYVIGGWLNKRIGAELGISEKTVKVHRGRVMQKMACDSLAELIRSCDIAKCKVQPVVHAALRVDPQTAHRNEPAVK